MKLQDGYLFRESEPELLHTESTRYVHYRFCEYLRCYYHLMEQLDICTFLYNVHKISCQKITSVPCVQLTMRMQSFFLAMGIPPKNVGPTNSFHLPLQLCHLACAW